MKNDISYRRFALVMSQALTINNDGEKHENESKI